MNTELIPALIAAETAGLVKLASSDIVHAGMRRATLTPAGRAHYDQLTNRPRPKRQGDSE